VTAKRIGVELPFLPMDAGRALQDAFPNSEIKDALFVLERLRTVKTPAELAKLRIASELVIDSMLEAPAPPSGNYSMRCGSRRQSAA
jgi:Xaa-Pro aminopeptidase